MARVEITRRELQSGSLPPVCAKSGEPTDHYVAVTVPIPHPRARWLLAAGVLPYFVWRRFFARRIVARVPLSRPMIELRQRQHRLLVVAAFVFTAAAAAGLVLSNPGARLTVASTGTALAALTQLLLAGWRRDTRIRFAATRYGTVVMHRIHPSFSSALATGDGETRSRIGAGGAGDVPAPGHPGRRPTRVQRSA